MSDKNKVKDPVQLELEKALQLQTEQEEKLSAAEEQVKVLEEQLAKSKDAQDALSKEVAELKKANDGKKGDDDPDDLFKSFDVTKALEEALEEGGIVEVNKVMESIVNDTRKGNAVLSKALETVQDNNSVIMKAITHIVKEVGELKKAMDQYLSQPAGMPRALGALKKSFDDLGVKQPTKEQIFKGLQQNIITQGEGQLIKHGYLQNVDKTKLEKVAAL